MPLLIICIVVGIIAIIYVLIAILFSINISSMSKAELELDPSAFDSPEVPTQWAKDNEFDYIGKFRTKVSFARTDIYAWRRTDRPTWFCTYITRTGSDTKDAEVLVNHFDLVAHFDLVTQFDSDISLTTCDTKDSHSSPIPHNYYTQSFSPSDYDGRWTRHIEMENFLMDDGGADLIECEDIFEELFVSEIRRKTQFVRKTPLWFLRAPLWYFFRRQKWHNLDICQQHQKGYIKLPNEQTTQPSGYLVRPTRMI